MSSFTSALVATLASALLLSRSTLAQVSLSPAQNAQNAGSTISNTINPSYAGFGIEPSDLFVFVGTSSPLQLTYNLLSNLANYTGAPPHIRVGGNAGDTMLYDDSVTGYALQQNPNPTGSGYSRPSDYYFFGPDYFKVIDYFPSGTPVTYGLNLAYEGSDALQRIVAQASAALNYVGTSGDNSPKLYSLEIGNEPDLYTDLGYRPSGWGVTDFGNEWASRAQAVYNQSLQSKGIGTNFFEVAATATTASKAGQPFRISNLVGNSQGVAVDNGVYVAGWNQHDYFYYVGVTNWTITIPALLDLSITVGQFHEWAMQLGQAQVTGKPYYLREMGSIGPNGIKGISDTFANALWTLNFFFYAASIGVDSVQMHMTQYSFAAPWQPNNFNGTSPHVRPTYYAWAAWAQIIGPTCNSKVASITLNNQPSSYTNRLSAYGVYRASTLTTVVLINTQVYYSGNGNANYQNFMLSLPSLAGKTVYLSVLYADGVESTSNVQWNGISYESSGTGQPRVVNGTQWTMTVGSDGSLTVPVRDSQVVAVSTVRLGHESVDTQNCQNLAASAPTAGGSGTAASNGGQAAPTFKATSGFKTGTVLSKTAIIAIAAGGGAALLVITALLIWCCVRSCKKSNARKAHAAAILKAPPRNDDHPLLERDLADESHASYPAYQNSPGLKGWESPMTSLSHGHQVHPSQSYHNMQPEYEYAPAAYQVRAQQAQGAHAPLPQQTQQYYQQQQGYLQNPYQNHAQYQIYGQTHYSQQNGHAY